MYDVAVVPIPQVPPRRISLTRAGSIGQAPPSARLNARRSRDHSDDPHLSPTPSELQVRAASWRLHCHPRDLCDMPKYARCCIVTAFTCTFPRLQSHACTAAGSQLGDRSEGHASFVPVIDRALTKRALRPQALHTHGRRLRVSMEGDAVSPTSPAPSPRADSFHNLQRTSWEQQRTRSFDSARGRAQVRTPAEPVKLHCSCGHRHRCTSHGLFGCRLMCICRSLCQISAQSTQDDE